MKKGTLVRIDFEDHFHQMGGVAKIIPCTLVGWVLEDTPKAITVAAWISNNNMLDENTDTYAILKHPGIKIRRINDKQ